MIENIGHAIFWLKEVKKDIGMFSKAQLRFPQKSAFQVANMMVNLSDDEKNLTKTSKLALEAFEDLILSVENKTEAGWVAFDLVDRCNKNDNPDGDVSLACKRLIKKYEPKTAPSYI